jgi:hypothetical protein
MRKTFLLLILGLFLNTAFVTSCKNSAEDEAIKKAASCTDNTKSCCQAKQTACRADCKKENGNTHDLWVCETQICDEAYYDCIEKARE